MDPIGTKAILVLKYNFLARGKTLSCTEYRETAVPLPVTPVSIVELANHFHTQFGGVWTQVADMTIGLVYTQATYVQANNYMDGVSTGAAIPGTLDGAGADDKDMMGDDIALIIQKRTGLRGRENRGRMFIPGLGEQVNRHGYVDETFIDEVDAIAAYLGADQEIPGGVHQESIWSARHYKRGARDPETQELIGTPDVVPIVDCRWVNKLGTRKDRTVSGSIIAR